MQAMHDVQWNWPKHLSKFSQRLWSDVGPDKQNWSSHRKTEVYLRQLAGFLRVWVQLDVHVEVHEAPVGVLAQRGVVALIQDQHREVCQPQLFVLHRFHQAHRRHHEDLVPVTNPTYRLCLNTVSKTLEETFFSWDKTKVQITGINAFVQTINNNNNNKKSTGTMKTRKR